MRAIWAVFGLMAAACSAPAGGQSAGVATTPAAIPHACALLGREEAEAIAGEAVGEPRKGPDAPASADVTSSQCVYPSADGSKSLGALVRHSKKGDNSPGYARKVMVDAGMKVEDVPGLGDTAFWAGVQLQAYKGAHVQVIVTAIGLDRAKERATAAARKVLEKL